MIHGPEMGLVQSNLPKYKQGNICDAVAVSIAGAMIGVVGLYRGLCS